MSRKPPARLIKSHDPRSHDRRTRFGLNDAEPPKKPASGSLLITILIVTVVTAAIALWGSAFAAATLALSGEVGLETIRHGLTVIR